MNAMNETEREIGERYSGTPLGRGVPGNGGGGGGAAADEAYIAGSAGGGGFVGGPPERLEFCGVRRGMVVKLKSGGPCMTVVKINSDSVCCHWFDTGKLQQQIYHPDALTVIPVGEPVDPLVHIREGKESSG